MTFQFEIANRLRTVEVRRQSDGYLVSVDGRRRFVHATRVDEDAWSLLVRDDDGGGARSVEAAVQPGNGTFDVQVDGVRVTVHLRNGRGRRLREARAGHGSGFQRVSAPMPGKVVRVLVKVGDTVTPRQVLVVVEAMKMENELRAAREGVVNEVFVAEGQSVEAGTPLVVVE